MLESHRNLLAIQAAFETENEATKERLQILEDNLDETRMELVKTKVELAESRSQLSRSKTWRAESSFMSVCGYQSASWPTLGRVHFDSIASEYNNPGNMLDISTGVFTSNTAGELSLLKCIFQTHRCRRVHHQLQRFVLDQLWWWRGQDDVLMN